MGNKTYILTESDIQKLLEKVSDKISKKVNPTGDYVIGRKITESLKQAIPAFCQKNLKELVCAFCEDKEFTMCDKCLDEQTKLLTTL